MLKKVLMFAGKLVASAKAISEEVFTDTYQDWLKQTDFDGNTFVANHTAAFVEGFFDLSAQTCVVTLDAETGKEVAHIGLRFKAVWQLMEAGENVFARLHEKDDDAVRAFGVYFSGKEQPKFTKNPQFLIRTDEITWLAIFVLEQKVSKELPFDHMARALAQAMNGEHLAKTGIFPLPGFVHDATTGRGNYRVHLVTLSDTPSYSMADLFADYGAFGAIKAQPKAQSPKASEPKAKVPSASKPKAKKSVKSKAQATARTARASLSEMIMEASDVVQVKAGGEGFILYIQEIAALAKLHGYTQVEALGFTQDIFKMIHHALEADQQQVFTEQVVRNAIHRAYASASVKETAKQ